MKEILLTEKDVLFLVLLYFHAIIFLKKLQKSYENTWDLETWFLLAKNS